MTSAGNSSKTPRYRPKTPSNSTSPWPPRSEAEEPEDFELPDEANEADVAEQHQEVKGDDEKENAYR